MASRSTQSFGQRAAGHPNQLVKRLFSIAEKKSTNVVLSADLTTTKELLEIADRKSQPLENGRKEAWQTSAYQIGKPLVETW